MEKFEIRRLISLVSFSDSVQILYTIIVYNTIIVNESKPLGVTRHRFHHLLHSE